MANSPETLAHLADLLSQAGLSGVSTRKMFGEHAIYLDGKVVAFLCDDRLFVKPTPRALALLPDAPHLPPYPGARAHLAPEDVWDDATLLAQALCAVAEDLPAPPPKPRRAR